MVISGGLLVRFTRPKLRLNDKAEPSMQADTKAKRNEAKTRQGKS
jgi:hypothetical protein